MPVHQRPSRVFLGLMEICGYYGALNRGLREIGVDSHFLDMGTDTYQYGSGERRHFLIEWVLHSLGRFRATRTLSRLNPLRYLWTVAYLLSLFALLGWLLARFDVVVFKSGIGLFDNGTDIKLLKCFGKTVVFFYHGSDSRPPYINGGYKTYTPEWLADRARTIKRHLDERERYADYVVDNPLAAHLHFEKVCASQLIGNPVDTEKIRKAMLAPADVQPSNAVRILHAPSAPEIKGTHLIRQAIANLRAKGYVINYRELTGVPNVVVMQEIRQADFIVDELYSDTHGAMLSLEAAALGKPSIVGGYGFSELDEYIPPEARVPTVTCKAENIEATIERLLCDSEYRKLCGERATEFAERFATPRSVAERFLTLVSGEAPASWFFAPSEISYFAGLGAPEDEIRGMLRSVLEELGPQAMFLDDKPAVLAGFIAYAGKLESEAA
jgi:glycosyltransferase involved in cell wall biosynthesis